MPNQCKFSKAEVGASSACLDIDGFVAGDARPLALEREHGEVVAAHDVADALAEEQRPAAHGEVGVEVRDAHGLRVALEQGEVVGLEQRGEELDEHALVALFADGDLREHALVAVGFGALRQLGEFFTCTHRRGAAGASRRGQVERVREGHENAGRARERE